MIKPVTIDRFDGYVAVGKAEKVPPGYLLLARNCRLSAGQVTVRPGTTLAYTGPDITKSINGLGSFLDASGKRVVVAFDAASNLFAQNPYDNTVGSTITFVGGSAVVTANGSRLDLTVSAFPVPADSYMDTAAAYGRLYMAFSQNLSNTGFSGVRQFYYNTTLSKYRYAGLGLPNTIAVPATVASSGTTGDIETGVRYVIVLFQTETGYVCGYDTEAITKVTVVLANKKLTITGLPIGPASNVTKRIVAFTQAGASSDGPYFYIAADAYVEGLDAAVDVSGNNISKTVVDDNTTTTVSFTFPDEALLAGVDVTGFLDKGQIVQAKSIYYSRTLKRLITCGEDFDTFRLSEADDVETFYQTTGLCKPGQGDGGIAMAAREWRSELYFLRNNGGHLAADTSLTPAEWGVKQRWEGVGPEGPWAVDTCKDFMAFAHRSGPYLYRGNDPEWVGYELSDTKRIPNWDKINWTYAHLIYVRIDEANKLVRFGVPMDGATKINMELIVDYSNGWKNHRWSYDDANVTRGLRTDTLTLGEVMLFGSNASDGLITYEDKLATAINGTAINQTARLSFVPGTNASGIFNLDSFDATLGGNGDVMMNVYGLPDTIQASKEIALNAAVRDFHRGIVAPENERFSLEFTNQGRLGEWFELQKVVLWLVRTWDSRIIN